MKNLKSKRNPYLKFKIFLMERGIKQSELCKILGKSASAINQNINGTGGDFSVEDLRIISQTYNISIDEFFIN
ncbi:Helix-turn-helix domain [Clostridioides difficile]|nr:Helix-turn-helix domain [Clostridioides difficile]VIF88423.1 Helix-turn-helix domain [Clostridioides difficile]